LTRSFRLTVSTILGASGSRFQRTSVFVSRCRRRCWFCLTASATACIFCRHLFVDIEFPMFPRRQLAIRFWIFRLSWYLDNIFDSLALGSTPSLVGFIRHGGISSVTSAVRSSATMALLGSPNLGSRLSIRRFVRLGSSHSSSATVYKSRDLSVLATAALGSSCSIARFGRLGSRVSVFASVVASSSLSTRGWARKGERL
jgi:hypothetical protein